MRTVRALIALQLSLALVTTSCVYGIKSLPRRSSPDELPLDAQAESARRTSRRIWSFAASAVELGLGLLAHAAASRTSNRDALFFEGVREVFLFSGAGELALATVDTFLETPFVDPAGTYQRPDLFSAPDVAPSTRWQADAGAGVSFASQRRLEVHYDVAAFHWVTPTLRMRYQLAVDHGQDFAGSTTETYYGLGGGASIEWSPNRWHYGRHPRSGLALSLLPRAVVGSDRDAAFGLRATIGWELGPIAIGIGASQIVGDDRHPGIEAWFGIRPITTD